MKKKKNEIWTYQLRDGEQTPLEVHLFSILKNLPWRIFELTSLNVDRIEVASAGYQGGENFRAVQHRYRWSHTKGLFRPALRFLNFHVDGGVFY